MPKQSRYINHLKGEKSPYLLQHAENPVEWYPWSREALERARNENKPLLVSIGYSSCHWCHVMERESFEDGETARVMNDNFVNIKVDREERPDVDSLYMKAVQAMTGHAGWPLTVFATPEGVPFYGGSYFPPDDRFGLPSFRKVLLAVSLAYKKNREKIDLVTSDVEQALSQRAAISPVELKADVADNAFDAARLFYDPVYGGFGRGTKFPHTMFLKFLLQYHRRTGDGDAIVMVEKTLTEMAEGGIYDHIGGGFHRYAVDDRWDIPHFEKMLYDNSQLAELYAAAYEATGEGLYKEVAEETLGYMLRELGHGEGGFYASQDADVKGEEGSYYLWEAAEVSKIIGKEAAPGFCDYYSITDEGNYEGKSMPRVNRAATMKASAIKEIKKLRGELLKARQERAAPDTDRKIITAWNGLAISALARASKGLKRAEYLESARRCARFLLSSVVDGEGRVMRYYLDGKAGVKGMLEDYALLGSGLFSVYSVSGEHVWLEEAKKITDAMIGLFYDEGDNLFYDTGNDQEALFVRERDLYDSDIPSGNGAAAALLFNMGKTLGEKRYTSLSEGILRSSEGLNEEPLSHGEFLYVLESFLKGDEKTRH